MKILLINKFLFPKGGDAITTIETGRLLTSKGHEVILWGMEHPQNPYYPYKDYFVSHVDFDNAGGIKKLKNAIDILYSFEAKKKLEQLIIKIEPDIAHLHNFAHQISPSILQILKKYNIPVVMTMHDYKMVCATYSMLSKGEVCEKCKGGRYVNCFFNKCTKESAFKSLLNTMEMYLHHTILHIYDLVNIFISPSQFLKCKVKEMGFEDKVCLLPNFVDLNEFTPQFENKKRYFVYCGRLSREKGISTLISAARNFDMPVKIIGDGPHNEELHQMVDQNRVTNVHFLGYLSGKDFTNQIRKAMAVVVPSECYENNPRSAIESFALGTPVIGAKIGGIPELVVDGVTGYLFEPGDVEDLCDKIFKIYNSSAKACEMGRNARRFVEEEFNSNRHYNRLMEIYESIAK